MRWRAEGHAPRNVAGFDEVGRLGVVAAGPREPHGEILRANFVAPLHAPSPSARVGDRHAGLRSVMCSSMKREWRSGRAVGPAWAVGQIERLHVARVPPDGVMGGEKPPRTGATDPVGALDEPAHAQCQHGHNGNDHPEAKPQQGSAGHAAEVKRPDRVGGLRTVRCGFGEDLEAGGCRAAAWRESTKPIGTRSSRSSMRRSRMRRSRPPGGHCASHQHE